MKRRLKDLRVEERLIGTLKPNPANARTHTMRQIAQIAASIAEFGFTNPILIDQNDVIIAGHGRLEGAKTLGFDHVPTILIDYLTDEQKRAYIIADNKLALNAGWDPEILQIELQHLTAMELDFDVEITGFESAEIAVLLDGGIASPENEEDTTPTPVGNAVTEVRDMWILGDHRIICGDARDRETYRQLMDEPARVMFADAPYNVKIDGHVCGLGSTKHREFAMASGEMSKTEFTSFLACIFSNAISVSVDGAIHFVCMDWRHVDEVLRAGTGYSELKNLCVWNKDNAGMGSFYRSKHELVFVFKVGRAPHVNNIELGRHGRYRTNVWDYPGVNTGTNARRKDLELHPTVKPIALVADAIRDCSQRNDIVLDPFGGSGTTLIAAARTGRRARLIEIDPLYVDVTIRRWQELTGGTAVNATTSMKFDDKAAQALPIEQAGEGQVRGAR